MKPARFIWIPCLFVIVLCICTPEANASLNANNTINKVHVVFMNHLDVGYSDGTTDGVGYAIDVINRYFTEYFPRAIFLAKNLTAYGYEERFIYTTHPWLVSLYINCPDVALIGKKLKCPSFRALNQFQDAVKNGSIAWHAGPMNMQTDNMGASLFDFSLDIAQSLDAKFGIDRNYATYSQRDVPGMTKAVLPILRSRGVKAISVGVNPGSAPPAVPSPFVWKFSEHDEDGVMAFWNKGGYPLNPGRTPSKPGGLARDECVTAPGLDEALCFAFRTDNTGPPVNTQEILTNYEVLRAEFPGAEIFASTFDNFVASLETVKSSLPVHHFEIGDTWIQGIAADPRKISMYRAFVRCLDICIMNGNCSFTDSRIFEASRLLLKLPEHTWGAHNFLNSIDWSNSKLASARRSDKAFKETEVTWHEQRQFLYLAHNALETHPLADNVTKALAELDATPPDLTGYYPSDLEREYKCQDGKIIQFAIDGSLSRLYDPINQVEWASDARRLGQVTYETFVEEDFASMARQYNYINGAGYDKPNMTANGHPVKNQWPMGVIEFYRKNNSECDFWLQLKMFDIETGLKYGAPNSFYLNYASVPYRGFDVTVIMADKRPTRLPESVSLKFTPNPTPNAKWGMSKMGKIVEPCNIVLNGSQYVHAIDKDVRLTNATGRGLSIAALDSPVVQWGTSDHSPSPFPVPLQPFPCSSLESVAFNLFNNIWNTNYMYWYPYTNDDANFKSRFSLYFL